MQTLLALAVVVGLCGDCNNDGRVTVNELIVAVKAALADPATPTPTDDCGIGCYDSGACPDVCWDVPYANGRQCDTSMCWHTDEQLATCVAAYDNAHPGACWAVTP